MSFKLRHIGNITNFKDLIPESFKEEKALDNFNNMEDFVKSYLHAQKLVGADKIPVPNKHATEEDWNEVFKRLGAPSDPNDYKYDFKDQEMDSEAVQEFNKTAHRLGLLPKQAEGLIKFYNEMNGNIAAFQEDQAAQAQLNTETEFLCFRFFMLSELFAHDGLGCFLWDYPKLL